MSLNMTWTIVVCNACVGDEINWMAWGGVKRDDAPSMCVCAPILCVREKPGADPLSCLEMSLVYRISVVAKKSCFMPSHWFFYWPCWLPGLKSLPCEANEEETSEPYHPPMSHCLLFVFINSASFLTMTTLPISTHWSSSAEIMKWIIDEADRALTHSWNY